MLERHSDSNAAEKAAFERINAPHSPHRVILLVNMGTEGWNVPSLFACALARKLRTSNNFVLQAASRCLRQVSGNSEQASIYLSVQNRRTLDKELAETYKETLDDLRNSRSNSRTDTVTLRKLKLPPLVIKQLVRTVIRKGDGTAAPLRFEKPAKVPAALLEKTSFRIARQYATRALLKQTGDTIAIKAEPDTLDLYTAATELAAIYRLDEWAVLDELRRVYPGDDEIPLAHLAELGAQIEAQTCRYEVKTQQIDRALALIKTDENGKPLGFDLGHDDDGTEVYTAEIRYPVQREKLLAHFHDWQTRHDGKSAAFGFHYTPYAFDSNPELFEQLFEHASLHAEQVEDIYFIGAITDPQKSDFYVEYLGEDSRWHRYTPDFIIRRKDGRCLIVEIKAERERKHPVDGEAGRKALAVRQWETLNPDRLKYQMIFVKDDLLASDQTRDAREFVEK